MNKKPLFAIGVLALAISQVAYAKDDDKKKSKDTETLDEVTVSAEGVREELLPDSPKNAYRLPVSAANITQTITREQIQQFRPRDVFQLLDNATGVIATQGSRKGFSGLTIRGDSNFRYIVDGAYLQPSMASRMMASLPVMAIEEVKIVRGGSALTMGPMSGSASPGGAPVDGFIIIRTRKTTKDGGQARVAGESFDGVKGDLLYGKTFGDQEDKGYVQGLISHQRTDGPGQPLDTPQTGPGTSSSFNRSSIRTDGMFKGGYEGNGLMVDFMAFKDDSSFGIPNANIHGSGSGNWKMTPSRTEIYAINASYTWDDIHTTLINASHSTNKQHFVFGGPISGDKENINEVTHLNVRHNMDIDKTRVMVGGDFMHWDAPNGQLYYEGIQREEDTLGWFAQVEQKFFDDKLTLDGSYRGDKVDVLHGLDYYAGGSQPPGGVNSSLKTTNKTLPTATFFNVGAGYEFIKNWKLIGRYGETDVSSSGMNVTAGTQLKEQHQIKAEIGIQGQVTSWFNPAVNYFHRDAQNELNLYGYSYDKKVGNVTSHVTCQAANATSNVTNNTTPFDPCYSQSNTVRDGFEVTSTGQIGSNTNYNFGWTSYTKLNNAALGTTARNQVNMSFGHRFDLFGENFNLTGAFKYLPKYKGSQTDAKPWSGGYTRYDFGLGHDFKLAQFPLTATVYGQNLTDERFETSSGVQDVGRVVGIEFVSSF